MPARRESGRAYVPRSHRRRSSASAGHPSRGGTTVSGGTRRHPKTGSYHSPGPTQAQIDRSNRLIAGDRTHSTGPPKSKSTGRGTPNVILPGGKTVSANSKRGARHAVRTYGRVGAIKKFDTPAVRKAARQARASKRAKKDYDRLMSHSWRDRVNLIDEPAREISPRGYKASERASRKIAKMSAREKAEYRKRERARDLKTPERLKVMGPGTGGGFGLDDLTRPAEFLQHAMAKGQEQSTSKRWSPSGILEQLKAGKRGFEKNEGGSERYIRATGGDPEHGLGKVANYGVKFGVDPLWINPAGKVGSLSRAARAARAGEKAAARVGGTGFTRAGRPAAQSRFVKLARRGKPARQTTPAERKAMRKKQSQAARAAHRKVRTPGRVAKAVGTHADAYVYGKGAEAVQNARRAAEGKLATRPAGVSKAEKRALDTLDRQRRAVEIGESRRSGRIGRHVRRSATGKKHIRRTLLGGGRKAARNWRGQSNRLRDAMERAQQRSLTAGERKATELIERDQNRMIEAENKALREAGETPQARYKAEAADQPQGYVARVHADEVRDPITRRHIRRGQEKAERIPKQSDAMPRVGGRVRSTSEGGYHREHRAHFDELDQPVKKNLVEDLEASHVTKAQKAWRRVSRTNFRTGVMDMGRKLSSGAPREGESVYMVKATGAGGTAKRLVRVDDPKEIAALRKAHAQRAKVDPKTGRRPVPPKVSIIKDSVAKEANRRLETQGHLPFIDTATSKIKFGLTVPNPQYWARNYVGGAYNAWIAGMPVHKVVEGTVNPLSAAHRVKRGIARQARAEEGLSARVRPVRSLRAGRVVRGQGRIGKGTRRVEGVRPGASHHDTVRQEYDPVGGKEVYSRGMEQHLERKLRDMDAPARDKVRREAHAAVRKADQEAESISRNMRMAEERMDAATPGTKAHDEAYDDFTTWADRAMKIGTHRTRASRTVALLDRVEGVSRPISKAIARNKRILERRVAKAKATRERRLAKRRAGRGTTPGKAAETVWYRGDHGTDFTKESFSSFQSEGNLYGPGMYLTDDPRVARGYAGAPTRGRAADMLGRGPKIADNRFPTITRAQVEPERILDLDKPAPELTNAIVQAIEDQGHYGGITDDFGLHFIDELLEMDGQGATGTQIYGRLREELASAGRSMSEADDLLHSVHRTLREEGIDAFTHKGGGIVAAKRHRVLILLDPLDEGGIGRSGGLVRTGTGNHTISSSRRATPARPTLTDPEHPLRTVRAKGAGAAREPRPPRRIRELGEETVKVGGERIRIRDLVDEIEKAGVSGGGQTVELLGASSRQRRITQNFEDHPRVMAYLHYRGKGASPAEASRQAQRSQFDYGALGDSERRYLRRIMPFYTWRSRNIMLQGGALALQPGKLERFERVKDSLADEAGLPKNWTKGLKPWELLQDPLPTPGWTRNNGRPGLLFPNLPSTDQQLLQHPEAWRNAATSMVNPLYKTPIELLTNYDFFYKDQIETDYRKLVPAPSAIVEHMPAFLREKFGAVYDPKEKIWKWSPQANKVLGAFPSSQLAGAALSKRPNEDVFADRDRAIGFATGVRPGRYTPTGAKVQRLYDERDRLTDRLLVMQQSHRDKKLKGGGYTKEFAKLKNRIQVIEGKLEHATRKAKLTPFDAGVDPKKRYFEGYDPEHPTRGRSGDDYLGAHQRTPSAGPDEDYLSGAHTKKKVKPKAGAGAGGGYLDR